MREVFLVVSSVTNIVLDIWFVMNFGILMIQGLVFYRRRGTSVPQ